MKTAIAIINGIQFPHSLVDRALAWAKKEGAQLDALFLTSGDEMPEEYAFPGDIDLAEKISDTEDTENDSAKILRGQVKFFKDRIKAEGVSGSAQHVNNASLDRVLEKVKSADLLFVDPDSGEITLQAVTRFKLQELVDKSPVAVDVMQ